MPFSIPRFRWYKHNNFDTVVYYLHETILTSGTSIMLAKVYSQSDGPFRISVKDDQRREKIMQMCHDKLAELVAERMAYAS